MLPATILILLATLYRILLATPGEGSEWIPNFSPLASIVLCGAVFFPKRTAVAVPMAVMLLSDWILNTFVYHVSLWTVEIFPRYLAFALVAWMAFWIRRQETKRIAWLFGGTMAAALVFFLITNTAAWVGSPVYGKNLSGWLQALSLGEPGYPQTWIFFRNSLVSDLLFTGLFLGCISISRRYQPSTQVAAHHETSAAN